MKTNVYVLLVLMVAVGGCGDSKPTSEVPSESAIHGSTTIPCDSEVFELFSVIGKQYAIDYPNAKVTYSPMTSRNALRELMSGRTKGIIMARDYLDDEDSAMKSNGYEFPRTLLATDALVFYVSKAFPYDTMSSQHIKAWLQGTLNVPEMKHLYPKLGGRVPTFVVPAMSSVYANVILSAGIPVPGRLTALPTRDSIRKRILGGENALIGLGYLSQFAKDTSVKMLRLSYNDSAGTYQHPKVVHAANVVRDMYPFPVRIYFVLKDTPSQHSLTSGVMQYLARDAKPQRAFFDAGIVPAYAKLELILPD